MTYQRLTPQGLAVAGLILAGAVLAHPAVAQQVFEPTSGTHAWNNDANWGPAPPQPFPNGFGAAAEIQGPTGALTVQLGQPITLGSLTINKSLTATFNTTVSGSAANNLTFDGGGTIATTASFTEGGGVSIISAPIAITGPLTITQGDDGVLRFAGVISGPGDVLVNRDTNGDEVVAFNAANTYSGTTTVSGNAGTNFVVLQLNHANAIPGGIDVAGGTSNITLTNSAVLGLGSTDFKRSIGTGPDQIQFVTPVNSGFASFNGTRVVNIGGNSETVNWAAAGLGQLTLGAPTSTGTVEFQNPLNLGNAANRNIRVLGADLVTIDAIITGSITSTGAANNLTKVGNGTLLLRAANSYTGATIVNGGSLVADHPQALPAGTNIQIGGTGVLGLSVGDLAANLGDQPGEVQFTGGNGGFAAYNGHRKVTLNGGATLVWGEGGFIGNNNFILSWQSADGLIEITNPIDLNGGVRTLAGREGLAAIDSRLSGVLSGDGGILKTQAGTLDLSAANTYTGVTTTQGGVLLLTNANSIPGGINGGSIANITLNGGSLGLGHGDFTAPLGFGPGQVQWSSGVNAGFSAFGGDRIVNLGGAGAQVAWGVNGFATNNLILNWESADSLLEFVNPIDLNGDIRTLAGRDGSARIDSRVSGVISGDGGILKGQGGTLDLSAANTYTGTTQTNAGVLLLTNANSIPGGITGGSTANVILNGGVLGLGHGDLTAPLGTGPGQIRFNPGANTGFAAFGDHRVVNLGGAGAQVVWGQGNFATNNLILGWESGDALIEFANDIDLNGGARTFAGRDGLADVDSRVSGVISGSGSVVKAQPGTTEFTAANAYDSGTTINAGRLLANNTTGSAVGTGDVAVNNSGTLGGTGFVGTAGDPSNLTVNAGGRVDPGVDAGQLTIFGNVTWGAGSFFDVDVAGSTPGVDADQLTVNGAATLAGTLHIDLAEGFTPGAGLSLQVLTAASGVTGTFDNVTWTGETTWEAIYGANAVSIVAGGAAGFAADFDGDGDVDSGDLVAWRGGFGTTTGATRALGDADGDGDVDGNDFLTWQRELGSGLGQGTAAVPEPSTLVLAALAALHIRRRAGRRSRRDLSDRLRRGGAVHPGRALHGAVAPKLAWLGNRA